MFVALLFAVLLAGCHSTESLSVQVIKTDLQQRGPGEGQASTALKGVRSSFRFPEQALNLLAGKSSLGIAFSGGGNRAAVCALGQARALTELGIMQRASYVSAISGGSWFAVPYTFLPENQNDSAFLGAYMPPETLGWEKLNSVSRGSFAWSGAKSQLALNRLFHLRGDENYAHVLKKIYLEPFELGDEHRFFTCDDDSLALARKRNTSLKPTDFYVARRNRPYLIVGCAIAEPFRYSHFDEKYVPIEITPTYSGTLMMREKNQYRPMDIGGGFVESYGYDSVVKSSAPRSELPRKLLTADVTLPMRLWPLNVLSSPRFALSDVIAASGSAPSAVIPELSWIIGFPEFQYWAPGSLPACETHQKIHVDGGAADNSGVASLVGRKVKRVIAFVNAEMRPSEDFHKALPSFVAALFGDVNGKDIDDSDDSNSVRLPEVERFQAKVSRIFDHRHYAGLCDEVKKRLKEQKAPIVTQSYVTKANPLFAVEPGQQVEVTWVFLGPAQEFCTDATCPNPDTLPHGSPRKWYALLPPDTRRRIVDSVGRLKGEFKRFPYYKTFFEGGVRAGVIELSAEQVNALSQYTSYVVKENADSFR